MEILTVKIVSCENKSWWYADLIGSYIDLHIRSNDMRCIPALTPRNIELLGEKSLKARIEHGQFVSKKDYLLFRSNKEAKSLLRKK